MQHPDTLVELMWQQQADLHDDAARRRLARLARLSHAGARRSPVSLTVDLRLPWGRRLRFSAGATPDGLCR